MGRDVLVAFENCTGDEVDMCIPNVCPQAAAMTSLRCATAKVTIHHTADVSSYEGTHVVANVEQLALSSAKPSRKRRVDARLIRSL